MNNLSEIRKQFANVYGVPGGNCKNSRREIFLKGLTPSLSFLISACVFFGMLLTYILLQYIPELFQFLNLIFSLLAFLFLLSAYFLNKCLRRVVSDIDAYETGIEGENAVATELNFLPAEFAVFHSVKLPDYDFDIDHVVVSPYGIIAIETKHWKTSIKYESGKFICETEGYKKNPVKQLQEQAIKLKEYFEKTAGVENLWIQGVLCFVGQKLEGFPEDRIDNSYYVTNEKKICDLIMNYQRYNLMPEETRGIIKGRLIDLCERNK